MQCAKNPRLLQPCLGPFCELRRQAEPISIVQNWQGTLAKDVMINCWQKVQSCKDFFSWILAVLLWHLSYTLLPQCYTPIYPIHLSFGEKVGRRQKTCFPSIPFNSGFSPNTVPSSLLQSSKRYWCHQSPLYVCWPKNAFWRLKNENELDATVATFSI